MIVLRQLRATWSVLRKVTLPSLRQHRARAILTLLGVLIGTEVAVAIALVNRSVLAAFEHTVDAIAGGADLQISNPAAGLPEALIEDIRAVKGVEVADGLVLGTLQTSHGDLTIFGVDLFADQRIRETQIPRRHVSIDDVLRFTNNPDSIALSTAFAKRAGLGLGSTLRASGPSGAATLTVRGLVEPVGPAALFGGAVAIADLPTAQRLMERGDRVDQISVKVAPGTPPVAVAERLARVVGAAGTVEAPRDRGTRLGSMLGTMQMLLTLASLNALVVGFFIIHHTIKTAITHRRRELALARAVGVQRTALLGALFAEVFAFGAIGALLGALLALGGAALSVDLLTDTAGTLYARIDRPRVTLMPQDFLLALVLGVGSALAGALMPARDVARLHVAAHLRGTGELPSRSSTTRVRALAAGLTLIVLGFALAVADLRPATNGARVTLIMLATLAVAGGYSMLIPRGVRFLAGGVRRLARAVDATPAVITLRSIERYPEKTRSTVSALMVAFALVLLIGTYIRSFRSSVVEWLDQVFAADLFVTAGPQQPSPSGPTLPGDIEALVRTTPGVEDVSATRMLAVSVAGRMALLHTDSGEAFARMKYPVVASASPTYLDDFRSGRGVLISDNLAYNTRLAPGDTVELTTSSGARVFPILAVIVDYTRDSGALIVERETYKRLWMDERANLLLVWVTPGTSVASVREGLERRLAARTSATIMTAADFKGTVAEALDRAFLLSYAIQIIAIGVAVIGVVNFFVAEAVDRSREIGLLRSVALSRSQLVRAFAVEAGTLGAIGGIAALLYGFPLSFLMVSRWQRLVAGWTLTFDFPTGLALVSVVLAAAAAVVAGYFPTRRATEKPPAELVGVE